MPIDLKFIEDLKNGDDKALRQVERLCYKKIFSYTRNQEVTEDLVQESLIKIIEALPDYSPKKGRSSIEANCKKWIGTIAFNTYLNYRVKKQREVTFTELAQEMGLDEGDQEAISRSSETLERFLTLRIDTYSSIKQNPLRNLAIHEILNAISEIKNPRKRVAVILKYIYGNTTEFIAKVMNENFDAIQSVIHRERKELKALLEKKGIDPDYLEPSDWGIQHLKHLTKTPLKYSDRGKIGSKR